MTRYDLVKAVLREFTWINIIYGILCVYIGSTKNLSFVTVFGILNFVVVLVSVPVNAAYWHQCTQCKKD